MKHVGKMKNNSAKVVVAYRTLPGDPASALVVGTQGLTDSYHDSLMTLLESDSAQSAHELADILATRRFPDGSVMLNYLHGNGHLKKVPTNGVLMTPNNQTTIPLNELNEIIATQKGITVEELAVSDGTVKAKPTKKAVVEEIIVDNVVAEPVMSPTTMRSRADALFKEAQQLRKQADALDPPKTKAKAKKASVTVE
jgi:hypothetical protein